MMRHEIRPQNSVAGYSLIVRIPDEQLDTKALRAISNTPPPFLAPLRCRAVDGEIELSYAVGSLANIRRLFGRLSPPDFKDMWTGILRPLLECDDWFMDPFSLVLDLNYIFYDSSDKNMKYLCVPSKISCSRAEDLNALVAETRSGCGCSDMSVDSQALQALQDFKPKEFLDLLNRICLPAPPVFAPLNPAAAPIQPASPSAPTSKERRSEKAAKQKASPARQKAREPSAQSGGQAWPAAKAPDDDDIVIGNIGKKPAKPPRPEKRPKAAKPPKASKPPKEPKPPKQPKNSSGKGLPLFKKGAGAQMAQEPARNSGHGFQAYPQAQPASRPQPAPHPAPFFDSLGNPPFQPAPGFGNQGNPPFQPAPSPVEYGVKHARPPQPMDSKVPASPLPVAGRMPEGYGEPSFPRPPAGNEFDRQNGALGPSASMGGASGNPLRAPADFQAVGLRGAGPLDPSPGRPVQKAANLRYVGAGGMPKNISLSLGQRPFTIGRHDIILARRQNDFEFPPDTRAVSRRHAAMELTDQGFVVTDLGSRVGTFVNGFLIAPGTPFKISPGDRIAFGNGGAEYEFEASF